MGDPRGIGPEVVVKALSREDLREVCRPLILGDPVILRRTAEALGLGWKIARVEEESNRRVPDEGLGILPLSSLHPGREPTDVDPQESSRASFRYLEKAGRMALAGQVEAIATGPVSKEAITGTGIPFRGHTEFFAGLAGTKDFVMMLAGERLRVALVTTHVPLNEVSKGLKEEKIVSVIEITGRSLKKYFGFPAPRIAVAAFNPHGGEGGLFGGEESIISRAVDQARGKNLNVSGPWPADSLFHRAVQGEYDAVVCMYHDQGLIPLKLLHFDSAVNVTLGLPFIRTSVDHGVAYDIAGKGIASSRSMEEAIKTAAHMALRKREKSNEYIRIAKHEIRNKHE
ncbi:MAG: 4-hydroxythreonine-4-phosphate dehydrogenase PdxA [Syntrophaceae bacterium]|nr:4-hydroxythreonine-4-phosphate dehydrogenase PdxA [Syntrophaceae bacterium]